MLADAPAASRGVGDLAERATRQQRVQTAQNTLLRELDRRNIPTPADLSQKVEAMAQSDRDEHLRTAASATMTKLNSR